MTVRKDPERDKAVRAARNARYQAMGLTNRGTPRKARTRPLRDHVAEVEAGLALGLDLDGIASDMDLKPGSVTMALYRKGRVDLVRALGIPEDPTAAARRANR